MWIKFKECLTHAQHSEQNTFFCLMKELLMAYSEFIKFCLVGISNTAVSLIAYYLLIYFGMHYLPANVIGFVLALTNSYILNSRFVFKQKKELETGIKFVLVYVSSFLLSMLFLFIMVDVLGVSQYVAPLINTVFNVIYNYTVHKLWTFKN